MTQVSGGGSEVESIYYNTLVKQKAQRLSTIQKKKVWDLLDSRYVGDRNEAVGDTDLNLGN